MIKRANFTFNISTKLTATSHLNTSKFLSKERNLLVNNNTDNNNNKKNNNNNNK